MIVIFFWYLSRLSNFPAVSTVSIWLQINPTNLRNKRNLLAFIKQWFWDKYRPKGGK